MVVIPKRINTLFIPYLVRSRSERFRNKKAAKGGIKKSAMIKEAVSAIVLVKASGRNNLPSAPIIVNTRKKLIMVVSTAVNMAPETSVVAL